MLEWTGERFLPWLEESQIHYEHLHRYAFAAQMVSGKKVIDLGCGEGYGSYMFAKEAKYVIGIDIDKQTAHHASSKYLRNNLEFICGSVLNVPIKGEKKFDIAVCFETIEHIVEHDKLLSEVKRLLKDDGLFIVSTPNKAIYTDEAQSHNVWHLKELYFDEFKRLLYEYFKNVDFYGQRVYIGSNLWYVLPRQRSGYREFVVKRDNKEFYFTESSNKVPRYLIALASNVEIEKYISDNNTWLVDISDSLIKEYEKQIVELRNKLQAKDYDITKLNAALQAKDSQIVELNSALRDKESRIIELNTALQAKGFQINELNFALKAKDLQIDELNGYLQAKDSRIAELDNAMQAKDSQIAELKAALQAKDSQITELNSAFKVKDLQIDELNAALQGKESQIAELNATLRRKDSEINNLNMQIQQMQRGVTMQLWRRYHKVIEWVLPPGTLGRRAYELMMRGVRFILNEGWRSFWSKTRRWFKGRVGLLKTGGEKRTLTYFRIRDRILPFGSRRRKAAKALRNVFRDKVFSARRKIAALQAGNVLAKKTVESQKNILPISTDFEIVSTKKIRVAFVGQAVYFKFMYESDLNRYYDVKEFELKWGGDAQYYQSLIEFNPDIAFFFRPELYPDDLLRALSGIKVALSSEPIPKYIRGKLVVSDDMKLRFESLKKARNKSYDAFFHYDSTSLRFLKENGFEAEEFFFPVATGIYRPIDCRKKWDWGFVGRDTPHRESFLGVAKRDFNGLHIAHGIYSEDFVQMMNQCKIGVNLHVDKNISLEPRVQMMMACKIMVMSEPPSHPDVFKPGLHYVEFANPEEFWEKLKYYLEHEEKREEIALNGFRLVREKLDAANVFHELINRLLDKNKNILDLKAGRGEDTYTGKEYLKLDLGCGKFKKGGFIGVNIKNYDGVDVVADLNQSLPFWDGSVKEIFCSHALEYIKDPYHLLDEMYRICISGALIELIVPLNQPDPTHLTIFDETWLKNNLDSTRFSILSSEVRFRSGISPSGKFHSWHEQKALIKVLKEGGFIRRSQTIRKSVVRPSVTFVIPNASISGGTMVICQHANRLMKKGYDVLLADQNTNDQYKLDWFPNLLPRVVTINKIDSMKDIAIATHWSTAYTVKDLATRRKIYFVQSDETRFNPPESKETELARRTYSFDFEFVVIARWLQKWLEDSFGKRAHYVPNGVDPSIFYPDVPLSPKSDRLRILLEGPIDSPFKGMEDAFKVVDGADCEVWCVSTYGRPKSGWKCDRFFNSVPQEMMRKIYSSCDVLIKMSRVEGFFLPPLEMMACGGTVITGKVTGYDEYVVDGYNGLLVEPGGVEAARNKLKQLIEDRDLLMALKKGGEETAKQWNWDYSSDRFEQVILNGV